jgi:hypothetical protein
MPSIHYVKLTDYLPDANPRLGIPLAGGVDATSRPWRGLSTINAGLSAGVRAAAWAPAVWNLSKTGSVGPLTDPTKVPGVATLPTGVTYNSGTKLVTVSSDNVVLDGWDFRGKNLVVNGQNVLVQNCRFNNDAGTNYFINFGAAAVVTSGRVTRCLFDGEKSTTGSYAAAVWVNTNGSGGIEIDLNRFKELPADCIYINGPTDLGDAPQNNVHHNWFSTGAFNNVAAHYDTMTFTGGNNLVHHNLIDMTPYPNTYGTNNAWRIVGTSKNKIEIYNNIVYGHKTLTSLPTQITGTYMFSVKVHDNIVQKNSTSSWFYPGPINVTQSSGNLDYDTGAALTEMSLVSDSTGPTISTAATWQITEGQTLTIPLTSPEAADWSITGTDVAKFTLNRMNVTFTAPPFASPTDTGGNNVYDFNIVAKDGLGNTTTKAIAVTVLSASADPADVFINRLSSLGTAPDATRETLYRNLFTALKNGPTSGTNILLKMDAIYVLAAHSVTASRQNLVGNQYNLTAVGTGGTFTTDRGVVGSSGTNYLDTGISPLNTAGIKFTQGDSSFGVYTRTLGGVNDGYAGQSSQVQVASGATTAATVASRLNSTAGLTTTGSFLPGFVNLNRVGNSSTYTAGSGDARENQVRGSATPTANTLVIGKGATVNSAGGQVSAAWMGGSLTQAEETDLRNALRTFLQGVGAV